VQHNANLQPQVYQLRATTVGAGLVLQLQRRASAAVWKHWRSEVWSGRTCV